MVLAVVASERINRTAAALVGAAVAVVAGVLSQEEAIEAVDWGVLGLLAGMMILVWAAEPSGIVTYLRSRSAGSRGAGRCG